MWQSVAKYFVHYTSWVSRHIWRSHGSHMIQPWVTYECAQKPNMNHTLYIIRRDDSFICGFWAHSYVTDAWITFDSWLLWHVCFLGCDVKYCNVTHDSFICDVGLIDFVTYLHVTWLFEMWLVTYSYITQDSFICDAWLIEFVTCDIFTLTCAPWLIGIWRIYVCLTKDSFRCVTWLIRICFMHSIICVTWQVHMCDMTHSYVWHDSFICVTWLLHMCDMTHSYVW